VAVTDIAGRYVQIRAAHDPLGRDLYDGIRRWPLWTLLAWNDIRQRYRRSYLGPFWMTLSMAVFVCALGFIYSHLFHSKIEDYLPFLAVGFIVWGFIAACLTEGCHAFGEHEALIKQLKVPYSTYVLCVVWRNVVVLLHTIILFIPISLYFGRVPQPIALLALPGFVLLALNLVWVTLVLAILNARFRDVAQIVGTVLQVAMFATPIMWPADALGDNRIVADVNPIYHLVELIRAPLLGEAPSPLSWAVAVGMLLAGWVLAMLLFRRVERRIVYWV
jgi:ABC-2 type transport system permease protein/lipopolysaccharide transport system permease protein